MINRSGGRDGAELFFAGPEGHLYAVSVSPGPSAGLSFGAATKLNVPRSGERHRGTIYDVSLDGRRVYFPHPTDETRPASSASCWDGER